VSRTLPTRTIVGMSRTVVEVTARVRHALLLALVGCASLVASSLVAPTMPAESLVVVAAMAAASATLVGLHLVAGPVPGHPALLVGRADAVPPILTGVTTDVVHHPLQPRAPGSA
jgi:hypothetical protein